MIDLHVNFKPSVPCNKRYNMSGKKAVDSFQNWPLQLVIKFGPVILNILTLCLRKCQIISLKKVNKV